MLKSFGFYDLCTLNIDGLKQVERMYVYICIYIYTYIYIYIICTTSEKKLFNFLHHPENPKRNNM